VVLDPLSVSFLFIAGILIASMGAMTGLGGGFLCVPFLLIVWNLGREEAVLISLTMIMANSISSSVSYIRSKMVDFKIAGMLAISAVPALYVGYILLKSMEAAVFDVMFSILLISVTSYILISRTAGKKEKIDIKSVDDKSEDKKLMLPHLSMPLSFLAGIASSAFGIGGGAILMPLQVGLLKMDVKKAIATSMFLLMILTGFRVIVISKASFDPLLALPLAAGAVIGAQIGALIVKRIHGQILLYILSFFLFSIAIYMGGGALLDII
jgi:uncharacterized membrane protein YfcA